MKSILTLLTLLTLVLSAFSFTHVLAETQQKAQTQKKTQEKIQEKMQKNFQTLLQLQKLAVDSEVFSNKSREIKINSLIRQLQSAAHDLAPLMATEKSPALKAVARIFKNYLYELDKNFNRGNKNYARKQIHTLSSLCLSCHSNLVNEQSWSALSKGLALDSLKPMQKAQFLMAVKRYDQAEKIYQKILAKKGGDFKFEKMQSLKQLLSVLVRTEAKADKAIQFVDLLLKDSGISKFSRENLIAWKKDLFNWKKELKKFEKREPSFMKLAEAKLKEAKRKEAYPADPKTRILYLIATRYIYKALPDQSDLNTQAKSFYLLAQAVSHLKDPHIWKLDDYYYEECIRLVPHSVLARQCLQKLNTEIYFSHSGSEGTFIPQKTLQKLKELEKLAE